MDEKVLQTVVVRAGGLVDGTIWKYGDGEPLRLYPKRGGEKYEFELDYENGEYITTIITCQGKRMDSIRFVTNTGNESEQFGGSGGDEVVFEAKPGYHILGIRVAKGKCPRIKSIIQRPSIQFKEQLAAEQAERMARNGARRAMQEARRMQREAMKAAREAELAEMREALEEAEEEAEEAHAVEEMKAAIAQEVEPMIDDKVQTADVEEAIAAVIEEMDICAAAFIDGTECLEEVPEGSLDATKENLEEMTREAHECFIGQQIEEFEMVVTEEASGRVEETAKTAPNTDAMEEVMTNLINEVGESMFNDFVTEMPEEIFDDEIADFVSQGVDVWEETFEERGEAIVEAITESCQEQINELVPGAETEDELEEAVYGFVDEVAEAVLGDDDFFSVIEVPDDFLDGAKADVLIIATMAWGKLQAEKEMENADALIETVEAALIEARMAQYFYEMTDDDEYAEMAPVKAEELLAATEALNEVRCDVLEDYEYEGYADNVRRLRREGHAEAGYLSTRSDHRGANGARPVNHSFARVRMIEANVGGKVDFIKFTYTDGTVRSRGSEDGGEPIEPFEFEDGETVMGVKLWKSDKGPPIASGIKFFTTTERSCDILGKKTKGSFGRRKDHDTKIEIDEPENGGLLWFNFPEEEDNHRVQGVQSGVKQLPGGSWMDECSDPYFDGYTLKATLNDEEVSFIPLPFEELGVVDGNRFYPENKFMDQQ